MKLNIPKKGENKAGVELYNHQARLSAAKTEKFARVREVLGGYSTAELLEILVDAAIEEYYDGNNPNPKLLPKGFKEKGGEDNA